jgi:hypothetical protein
MPVIEHEYAVEVVRSEVVEVVVLASTAKEAKARVRAGRIDGEASPTGESWFGGVRGARRLDA